MRKSVWLLAGLAALALIWAYVLTQRPGSDKSATGAVWVWRTGLETVERLVYRNGERLVTIRSDRSIKGAKSPILWVTSKPPPTRKRGNPNAGVTDGEQFFRGNRAALKLLQSVAELQAARLLGDAETLDTSPFGLEGSNHELVLERKGADPWRMTLGNATYGGGMRYAVSSRDNRVYMLNSSLIRRLAASARLRDRTVLTGDMRKVQRMRVERDGESREYWQLDGEGAGRPWSAQRSGGEEHAGAKALAAAVRGLAVDRYLPQEASSRESTDSITISLFGEGLGEQWLKITPQPEGAPLAVSSHTHRPVRLTAAGGKRLLKSLQEVFDGP